MASNMTMSSSNINFSDVEVDAKDYKTGVLEILKNIRQAWKPDDIIFKEFSEGKANTMINVWNKDDESKEDGLVFRIFFQGGDTGQASQIVVMQLIHAAGAAKKVNAIFKNGLAYAYSQGRTLEISDLNKPIIIRLLGQAAARVACIDLETTKAYDMTGKETLLSPDKQMLLNFQAGAGWLPEQLPDPARNERYMREFGPVSKVKDEWARIRARLDQLNMSTSLCHMDFHIKNIVYNEDKDEVNLLDFEASAVYIEGADIGYLCLGVGMWRELGFGIPGDYPQHVPEDIQLQYVQAYLEEKYRLTGKDPTEVTVEDVRKIHFQGRASFAVTCFGFACLLICMERSNMSLKTDNLNLGLMFYKHYLKNRHYLFDIPQPM